MRLRSFVFCGKGLFLSAKKLFPVIFLVSVAFVVRGEELVPDEEQEGKFFNVKTFNLVVLISFQLKTLLHTECATNSRRALQVFLPEIRRFYDINRCLILHYTRLQNSSFLSLG